MNESLITIAQYFNASHNFQPRVRYDVWMGNSRGNTYSRHHVSLSNNDKKYWDFSFHEMAMHDIPAEIDFIYSHRKSE